MIKSFSGLPGPVQAVIHLVGDIFHDVANGPPHSLSEAFDIPSCSFAGLRRKQKSRSCADDTANKDRACQIQLTVRMHQNPP